MWYQRRRYPATSIGRARLNVQEIPRDSPESRSNKPKYERITPHHWQWQRSDEINKVAQVKPETNLLKETLVTVVENQVTSQPTVGSKKQLVTSVVKWAT